MQPKRGLQAGLQQAGLELVHLQQGVVGPAPAGAQRRNGPDRPSARARGCTRLGLQLERPVRVPSVHIGLCPQLQRFRGGQARPDSVRLEGFEAQLGLHACKALHPSAGPTSRVQHQCAFGLQAGRAQGEQQTLDLPARTLAVEHQLQPLQRQPAPIPRAGAQVAHLAPQLPMRASGCAGRARLDLPLATESGLWRQGHKPGQIDVMQAQLRLLQRHLGPRANARLQVQLGRQCVAGTGSDHGLHLPVQHEQGIRPRQRPR
ncbi:MAG: hypothetical protein JM57_11605 [Comamonadaceae bacterium BICA1-1]|nr:MAG: hypothetical protein JM57_11605 [Comamonadaceae bacterium BICA1-1]